MRKEEVAEENTFKLCSKLSKHSAMLAERLLLDTSHAQ